MKKAGITGILAIVFLISISIVFAATLEKTKIYGRADPEATMKLTLDYSAHAVLYTDQLITKNADSEGNWEYKISTDPGKITLQIAYKGEEKEFSISTGQDFQVNWNGETFKEGTGEELTAGVEETNTTIEENTTTEVAGEAEETNTEKTTSESSGITGKSIFGDIGEIKIPGNWKIYLIIIAVFIAMIVANILSTLILGFFQRPRENRKSGPSREEIKIVKLSERLAQIKNNEEEVQRALEEARRNK